MALFTLGGFQSFGQIFTGPAINPFGLVSIHSDGANLEAVDIDADGDNDLFVSDEDGDITYYQNTGTATNPTLASGVQNPFGLQNQSGNSDDYVAIAFVDLDNDGDFDLFTTGEYGATYYYQNNGTASSPSFAASSTQNPYGIPWGESLRQSYVDIDADGDLDVFQNAASGSTVNHLYHSENTGSAALPSFSATIVPNPFGFTAFDVGAKYQEYEFADIDNDGDLDLFMGSGLNSMLSDILFYENLGDSANPDFSGPLLTNPFGIDQFGTVHQSMISPELVDMDNDGDLDLLFGDKNGLITYQENQDAQLPETYSSSEVCLGDAHAFPDGTSTVISSDTIQNSMLLSSSGLIDSLVVSLVLPILPQTVTINLDICPGSDYLFPDTVLFTNIAADTSYVASLIASSGCDSLVTFNLTVSPSACAHIVPVNSLDSNCMSSFINTTTSHLYLGRSVDAAGDVNGDGIDDFIVGGTGFQNAKGRAYVLFGGPSPYSFDLATINGTNGFELVGITDGDEFGGDVAGGGDINGDGFDDLIIGAKKVNTNQGAVYVVYGGPALPASISVSTLNGTNGITFSGYTTHTSFTGTSVASPGDVNDDGYDDILIGAPWVFNNIHPFLKGQSYLIFGGPSLPANLTPNSINGTNGITINGINAGDRSGFSVKGAGDINNDGVPDIVIGGHSPSNAQNHPGRAYVIFGSASLPHPFELAALNGTNGFSMVGEDPDDWAGRAVDKAGDVNADGIDDLIVLSSYAGPGSTKTGEAYVVYGSNSAYPDSLDLANLGALGFTLRGFGNNSLWHSVSNAGDWNRDGIDDVVIGAGTMQSRGHVYVVYGSTSPPQFIKVDSLDANQGVRYVGNSQDDNFGVAVSHIGDFNFDGYDDLVIGASGVDTISTFGTQGKAYVIYNKCMPRFTSLPDVTACDYYVFNGDTLTQTGIYSDTITTANTCDTIVSFGLTITPSVSSQLAQNVCHGSDYTYPDGTISTNLITDESHQSMFTSAAGCDSSVTVSITVLPTLIGSETSTICAEDSIVVNGTTYNAANPTGMEVFTGIGIFGCDSTVTVSINVMPAVTGSESSTICAGESVVVNGTTYNAANPSGTEVFVGAAASGCDSTVTINLTVLPALTGSETYTICANESIVVNGTTYNAANSSGTEVLAGAGQSGCDSTVTINLTVLPALTGSETSTICANESIVVNGTTYNAANPSGTEVLAGASQSGCDSTVTINLTVLPALTGSETSTICANESIVVNGTIYDAANPSGTEVLAGAGQLGCDSTVTINLTVLTALTGSETSTLCANESVVVNGTTYNAANPSGTEVLAGAGQSGCDSTVTINLTVLPALTGSETSTICANDSIVVNGTSYDAANPSGTEVFTGIGPAGCDSTVTVNLNVLPAIDVSTSTAENTITANHVGASYQWIDCNNGNASIAGQTASSFTANDNGSYAVVIVENGCTAMSECVMISGVSVREMANAIAMKVYPNPTTGPVTIDLGSQHQTSRVVVWSLLGQQLQQQAINSASRFQLDLPSQAGTYLVEVWIQDQPYRQRVIVR